MEKPFAEYLGVALLAGLLGALAMETVMWLITRRGWAKGNMVIALGALITRKRQSALQYGIVIHALSAIGFALLYTYAMMQLGLAYFPAAFFSGLGFGVLHGMVVSLGLVWVVAEHHPLAEFNKASFAVGLSHFAGHVAYGAAVGLVIGIASR